MVGALSTVFIRKAAVDGTVVPKATNLCWSLVGFDASQFCPYSMLQPLLNGFFTRWDNNSEKNLFTLRENNLPPFANLVLS